MPKIWEFSKKGDFGETTLPSGAQVSKSSIIIETCGMIDEAISILGCAKAATGSQTIREMLTGVQQHLFLLVKVAASADLQQNRGIGKQPARQLEEWAEHLRQELKKLPEAPEVVPRLPGKNIASMFINMGRSVTERAKLRAVELQESGFLIHPDAPDHLDRLQGFLFTLARYAEDVDSATGTQ
jgi:cob(I)alamin adenosyltransferase